MPPVLLLVDDDEAFGILMAYALKRSGLNASLRYVNDGDEAIQYLSRMAKYSDEVEFPLPALVLVDLKMPRVTGFELLQWKSGRPDLQKIPFVVFSSSDLQIDIEKASALGAFSYLVKPMDLPKLLKMVGTLDQFWVKT
jgi:CheY-like chemotaxis protein